jgi:DNA replication protein DnaC
VSQIPTRITGANSVLEHHYNYYSDTPNGYLCALGASNPRVEKDRIEMDKDKLLKQCYSWILDNADFQRWRDSKQSRLLWIKGDPGKGKTMIMIALAEELSSESKSKSRSLKDMARRLAS